MDKGKICLANLNKRMLMKRNLIDLNFATIADGLKLLIVILKLSMLDVCEDPGYTSKYILLQAPLAPV